MEGPVVGASAPAGIDVLSSIDPRLCVACKGSRGLCGIDPCPLLARIRHHLPQVAFKGRDLFGSSPPSLFVGRYGYPNVSVGPMLPPDHREESKARLLDDPRKWLDLGMADVVGLRSSLVRTTHHVSVKSASRPDRITQVSQELAMAARPVDAEVRLTKAPRFGDFSVAEFTAPHGPTVGVERAVLAENPRIERPIEKAVADTDVRAADAIVEMYRAGTDLYQLERILSAGLVGKEKARRLVPTRWSITATDDQVGLRLIDRITDLPTVDKPQVHFAERFGNRFQVLLLPRIWSFESLEVWMEGAFWARQTVAEADHEDHTGRSTYANTAGGYYATRLAVLEHLVKTGRQATAIVLREITDAYTTPLGVWVVRETCNEAMRSRPLLFEDVDSALRHMDRHAMHKRWQADAPFLAGLRKQRTLGSFGRDASPGGLQP